MEYVSRCRQFKFPVSRDIIRVCAWMVKEKLLSDERIEGKQRVCLNNFVVSEGWCTQFIARYNLNSRVLHGQAGSADAETAKVEMSAVRNRLAKYSAHEIYNVDGTALFYKSLPNRTYVLKSENNKYLRGIKK